MNIHIRCNLKLSYRWTHKELELNLYEDESKRENVGAVSKTTDRNPLVAPNVGAKVSDVSKQVASLSLGSKSRVAHVNMAATSQTLQG